MKQLRIKKKDNSHVEAGSLELAMRFKTKERGDIEVLNDLKIDVWHSSLILHSNF